MTSMNYLLHFAVLASSMAIASGIMCHQCQTLGLRECSDKYVADTMDECDDDNYCVKYKTIVWIRDSGYINGRDRESSVVTRSCEPKLGKKEGCIGWQNNGGVTLKCYCGSDGCNSGLTLTPKFLTASLVCLLGFFMAHFILRH